MLLTDLLPPATVGVAITSLDVSRVCSLSRNEELVVIEAQNPNPAKKFPNMCSIALERLGYLKISVDNGLYTSIFDSISSDSLKSIRSGAKTVTSCTSCVCFSSRPFAYNA